jgi:Leucine-rich repeat (LRR) protein
VIITVGNNKLQAIPPEIFTSLTKLRELQLYKNKLTVVPNEIGNLHGIERLSIASNNIRTVPDEIGECTQLKELYLSNNAKLVAIPGTCGHLRYEHVQRCPFKNLIIVLLCRMLRELQLRKCPALKQLPPQST